MIRLRINWTGPASGFSVMHFAGSLETPGDAQAAADAVSTWLTAVGPHMADAQAAQVDSEVLEVDVVTGQTTGVGTISSSAVLGSGGNNQVAQASMLLVRWRTGVFTEGREIRGRTFVPGIGAGGSTPAGEVLPALITAMDTANSAFIGGVPPLVVYSAMHGTLAEVSTANVWTEFAVMRSRRE